MNDLHLKAGLAQTEDDFEGNKQYIGTRQQWNEFDRLEEEQEADEIENQQFKYGEPKP